MATVSTLTAGVFGLAMVFAHAGSAQAQSWTGFYVGAQIGYGLQPGDSDEVVQFDKNLDGDFSDAIVTAAGANAFSPGFCGGAAATSLPSAGCADDEDGLDVGLRVGYDWQRGALVFGVLGDLSWADLTDSVTAFSTTPAFYTFTRELDWVGALRGRAGFGSGNVLVYGTAGGVLSSLEQGFTTSNAVNTFVPADEDRAWGYQAGGGLEFRWKMVSMGAEYMFTSIDDEENTVRVQGPAPATNPFVLTNASGTDLRRSDRFEFQTVRFTTSLRF